MEKAFEAFQKETLEGYKEAIEDLAKVMKELPMATKECHLAESEVGKIIKAAGIFGHPFKLMMRVSQNIMLNGIDIFKEVTRGAAYLKEKQYYEAGEMFGEAFDELFLEGSPAMPKINIPTPPPLLMEIQTNDERAYRFLKGFFDGIHMLDSVNQETLFNTINTKSAFVYGPVTHLMNRLKMN
jgi:tetratricopeptide (TPR) repeat protein